ncbi:type I-E CRISPR-associated protein Cas6/Cse3/CasE [Agromyces sp. NPDC057679]|uniref:type I-E CRISPR-associated protein Cas6/Cse3/CasE n=1 Tax=Agromyces sp. NPDC057679 TaxID=3346207 RepID=UPI00366E9E92
MGILSEVPSQSLTTRFRDRHRQIMDLFPAELPGSAKERRATSQVLFADLGSRVIIRSAVAPSQHVDGLRSVTERRTPAAGTRVTLRAFVNPVRRLRGGGIRPVDDIEEWFAERAAPALDDVDILATHRRNTHTGRSNLIIEQIDAAATITNHDALDELLHDGLGRGKSFGCGLILIGAAA